MNHVIHYHLPSKEDEFTHRNGRTARMLATGTAYVIAHESEKNRLYHYGMEVCLRKRQCHCKTSSQYQTIYIKWWKENKLNKIDRRFLFSERKLEKVI
jgi:superfamily II DNA/RNA helicase